MNNNDLKNQVKMLLFTAALGAVAGGVIWCFLKAVSAVTALLWGFLPEKAASGRKKT